jgi:hypothetical protein
MDKDTCQILRMILARLDNCARLTAIQAILGPDQRAESDSKRETRRAAVPPGLKIGRKWPVFTEIGGKMAKIEVLRSPCNDFKG